MELLVGTAGTAGLDYKRQVSITTDLPDRTISLMTDISPTCSEGPATGYLQGQPEKVMSRQQSVPANTLPTLGDALTTFFIN